MLQRIMACLASAFFLHHKSVRQSSKRVTWSGMRYQEQAGES